MWQIMQIDAAVSSFYLFNEGSRLADENMEIVSASPGVWVEATFKLPYFHP